MEKPLKLTGRRPAYDSHMYKNSKFTVLFPLLLAAGVVLGLLLGQYMGRNSTTSEITGMLRQLALPTNKLT